jgi:hypothetical protein
MAESHSTDENPLQTFRHCKSFRYEHFEGTKDEIQAAGFCVDKPFPGEPGGNKQKLSLGQVNGFASAVLTKQKRYDSGLGWVETGLFEVNAYYIDRNHPDSRTKWVVDFAPGVTRHDDIRSDVYIGSQDALIKAGLVLPEQFPGTANTGKVRTTFLPDGTRVKQGGSWNSGAAGTKTVMKFGSRIKVEILVDAAAYEERRAEFSKRFDDAALQYENALMNRIAVATNAPASASLKRKSHLRLVWSV